MRIYKIFIDKLIRGCYNEIEVYYKEKSVEFVEEIMVSVLCTCYNHGSYIKDALEGFVRQETTFPFEVLIHDDASTDGSAEIIREYQDKYPDIIKPIYQTENQYSQGIKVVTAFLVPRVRGKYIAFCEGDDFWTDEHKLQKQVDFLENNPEFTVCVHNTIFHDVRADEQRVWYPMENREIHFQDVMMGNQSYHASSTLVKADFYLGKPKWTFMVPGVGDLPNSFYYALSGRIMYLGDVMSHYRFGVAGSWTDRVGDHFKRWFRTEQKIIQMLYEIDRYYDYQHHAMIHKAIVTHKKNRNRNAVKRYLRYLAKCYAPWMFQLKRKIVKRTRSCV